MSTITGTPHCPAPLPDVLTVDEAAALLRVNRKTLYEAIRLNQVPGILRLGRAIRIGRDALLGWMRSAGSALGGHDERSAS